MSSGLFLARFISFVVCIVILIICKVAEKKGNSNNNKKHKNYKTSNQSNTFNSRGFYKNEVHKDTYTKYNSQGYDRVFLVK